MENYSYKVITPAGKEKRGSIQADSVADATNQLKKQGFVPISVTTQSALEKDIAIPGLQKKVKLRDLCVFCRQFSSILKSGVSVINALNMLTEQTESKVLKPALENVRVSVEKGETLSAAMRAAGNSVFPNLLVSMVAAGEASGNLEAVFDRMALQFEKDNRIKGMVKQAMIYPIILIIVAILIVIIMMVAVIPNFVGMFEDLGTDLPIFTKMVVNMSNAFVHHWPIILGVVFCIAAAYKIFSSTTDGRHMVDSIKLKLPVFGKLVQKTACARFTRILSTLIASGMPMMEALDIASGTLENVLYKDAITKVRTGIGLGMELSGQLKAVNLFPPMVIHMTNIGEETGNLENMLISIADYYDEEVEMTTKQITALMEPMIIVVMAVIVGGLVAAIYGPMLTLYNELG